MTHGDVHRAEASAGSAAWTVQLRRRSRLPLASENEFLKQLGERVRVMRSLRHMSRRELARRSGVSERYLALIEAGKGNVSIVLLLRIAHAVRTG